MANIGKDLALLTAGSPDRFNSLTILYGGLGYMWKKKVFFAFIKPERYTWSFIRDSEYFTVAFFPPEYNNIHKVFGYKSGRDTDKVKETGITPEILENGVAYKEANEVFVCKKLYMKQIDRYAIPQEVFDRYRDPDDIIYGETHYAIIGEIVDYINR